ncbi:MAG: type II toxin-antitoxin system VapC family toxin [Verrucomicrobia bacterium]|nr:type II toxin-antitoxin system VapC family toxin [Verrucomicrobiota bacterium]
MILVDANLLLYAEDSLSAQHEAAREWWDGQLSGTEPVLLCWPVLTAYLRIGTNPRLHRRPLTQKEAVERVQSWLDQPCVRLVHPTEQHWPLFQELLHRSHATGNLVSDAHLAALAVEHNCTLCSTDADFRRFPGLKWRNPLET